MNEIKKIFNKKIALWLENRGHKKIGKGKGKFGDECCIFEYTKELEKDFEFKTHSMRDIRLNK